MEKQTGARIANIILGGWLILSTFLWQHSHGQHMNALLSGLIVALIGLVAIWVPTLRILNTILAVWLFFSVWILRPTGVGTAWNHALVAIAIFAFSLIPTWPESGAHAQAPSR